METDRGIIQTSVHTDTTHQQAFGDALLQVDDVADSFFPQAGVFRFHFGNDTFLVGTAVGDGDEDQILFVVHGHGVIRQLAVDLIPDFF